jgi:hypothetical protein
MTTQIIRGTKEQIAQALAHTQGRVVEAILFVEDDTTATGVAPLSESEFEKLVSVRGADYSRESIYSRREGE